MALSLWWEEREESPDRLQVAARSSHIRLEREPVFAELAETVLEGDHGSFHHASMVTQSSSSV